MPALKTLLAYLYFSIAFVHRSIILLYAWLCFGRQRIQILSIYDEKTQVQAADIQMTRSYCSLAFSLRSSSVTPNPHRKLFILFVYNGTPQGTTINFRTQQRTWLGSSSFLEHFRCCIAPKKWLQDTITSLNPPVK